MQLNASVYDVWVFQRTPDGVEFLVLETSPLKAARHFNGGMFWQVPSGVQVITVFAVEVAPGTPQLNPDEHGACAWLPVEAALERVHVRGLKDGLRSVHEYITGVAHPAAELCLYPVGDP